MTIATFSKQDPAPIKSWTAKKYPYHVSTGRAAVKYASNVWVNIEASEYPTVEWSIQLYDIPPPPENDLTGLWLTYIWYTRSVYIYLYR